MVAGAYGFPIAVEIKKWKNSYRDLRKNTTFFGVYGKRDLKDGVEQAMTDAWIRPMEEKLKKI